MKNPFKQDKFKISDVVDAGPPDADNKTVIENEPVSGGDDVADPNIEVASQEFPGRGELEENGTFEQGDDRGPFSATYSGAKFFVNECNVEDIPILDVAQALSMNCRFNGHIEKFYSVAEHSVLVSNLVSEESALYGLLHDYAEAFVSDVPRPFKASITGHDEFEARVMAEVCTLYGLPLEIPEDVKYIDTHICACEASVLAKVVPDWVQYYDLSIVDPQEIKGLTFKQARDAFMVRFNDLTN